MSYMSSFERIGREEGRQEGRLEERQDIVRALLSSRFSVVDEELAIIAERLTQMPAIEFSKVLPALSSMLREDLLKRFGEDTVH